MRCAVLRAAQTAASNLKAVRRDPQILLFSLPLQSTESFDGNDRAVEGVMLFERLILTDFTLQVTTPLGLEAALGITSLSAATVARYVSECHLCKVFASVMLILSSQNHCYKG